MCAAPYIQCHVCCIIYSVSCVLCHTCNTTPRVPRPPLQEFVEARRTAALGLSPACSYQGCKSQPLELQGVPPQLIGNANGGYMCFTFFRRHVCGPQLEHVLWSCCTFYYLIGYHIKCCKV